MGLWVEEEKEKRKKRKRNGLGVVVGKKGNKGFGL